MKERIIMHSDINHCFAQIEEMMFPELKEVPMAVGGSESKRSGIILARNQRARSYGVKTAQTLREAKELCPDLHIVPPHYDWYQYYSEQVKDIYREYSDQVESFGIDEAWVDLTDSIELFGDKRDIVREIKNRVYEEVGLTISVGVSFNKIFAKLGSDLMKPDGLVYINKDNFQRIVWPREVDELLMVGTATKQKLNNINIYTIGDLAQTPIKELQELLGKNGEMIWAFANGIESNKVALNNAKRKPKSIGNGITTVKNMENRNDAKIVFQVLAESVASRAKDAGLVGKTITISIRNTDLQTTTKRKTLDFYTNTSHDIIKVILELLDGFVDYPYPLRSISVKLSSLQKDHNVTQLDFFNQHQDRHQNKIIDKTVDDIRNKFGFDTIKRCSVLLDEELTDFNPKGSHTVFPVSYF